MILKWTLFSCCLQYYAIASELSQNKPNIITIIGDDLGWNDVGFHGSNEIPTPNIDALAYNGLILNRHYTQPTCTPSRAAFHTGRYPIRYGLQGQPLIAPVRAGLPLNETLLTQHLKNLGYVTGIVGKWHMGYCGWDYTPVRRGYDSHFGYYNGWIRYNDSIVTDGDIWGYDARDNYEKAGDRFRDKYATDVFTDEAINIIKNHDNSEPLFLVVSHVAVHACDDNLLQVKNQTETEEKFSYIKDPQRRKFAGMLTSLDESVGKVIAALDEKKMLKNSIVLFIGDNGGATRDARFQNTGSNWPLRGWKGSVADGGVRGAAAIWSPLIKRRSDSVSNQLMHISDWFKTFYAAAGGNLAKLEQIDGINQWNYLTGKQNTSESRELLVNIDEQTNSSALIIGDWKYVRLNSSNTPFEYAGDSGRNAGYTYDMDRVLQSPTHSKLSKFSENSSDFAKQFATSRSLSTIDDKCLLRIQVAENTTYLSKLKCFETGCLFNIKYDPCEFTELSENMPTIRVMLEDKLNEYRKQVVPQQKQVIDPAGNPKYLDNYWGPWLKNC